MAILLEYVSGTTTQDQDMFYDCMTQAAEASLETPRSVSQRSDTQLQKATCTTIFCVANSKITVQQSTVITVTYRVGAGPHLPRYFVTKLLAIKTCSMIKLLLSKFIFRGI